MVLLCSYPDQYKKDTKQGFKWLNENGTICDFDSLNGILTRLAASIEATPETRALFNSKHSHIFVAAFKAFTESGRIDEEFGDFLEWFINGGNVIEIDGKSWDAIGTDRSTRDSSVVHGKLSHLIALEKLYSMEMQKAA